MTKKLKKPKAIRIDLPYWPSKAFMKAAVDSLKEKGMVGSRATLESMVKRAYWKGRAQILAELAVPK